MPPFIHVHHRRRGGAVGVKRVGAAAVALAASPVLLGSPSAAAAQDPSVTSTCTRVTSNEPSLQGTPTDFPPDETFLFLACPAA